MCQKIVYHCRWVSGDTSCIGKWTHEEWVKCAKWDANGRRPCSPSGQNDGRWSVCPHCQKKREKLVFWRENVAAMPQVDPNPDWCREAADPRVLGDLAGLGPADSNSQRGSDAGPSQFENWEEGDTLVGPGQAPKGSGIRSDSRDRHHHSSRRRRHGSGRRDGADRGPRRHPGHMHSSPHGRHSGHGSRRAGGQVTAMTEVRSRLARFFG